MGNRSRHEWLASLLVLPLFAAHTALQSPSLDRQLLVAAARANIETVADLLSKGANVNADNGHGVTPLWYAADKANVELVKLLLEHGADPNAKDLEYGKSPLRVAAVPWSDLKAEEARTEIVELMIEKGGGTEGDALVDLIRGRQFDAVRTILGRGEVSQSYLNLALAAAERANQRELVELLVEAGAKEPGPLDDDSSPERLQMLMGTYRSESGEELTLASSIYDDQLMLERSGRDKVALLPAGLTILRSFDLTVVVTMDAGPLPPARLTLKDSGSSEVFTRVAAKQEE